MPEVCSAYMITSSYTRDKRRHKEHGSPPRPRQVPLRRPLRPAWLRCRGYKGRIKNVTDREVRIELEAQARTVTVRRDQIPPEDGGAPMPARAPFASAGGATPAYGGMRTPAHITATPRHLVQSHLCRLEIPQLSSLATLGVPDTLCVLCPQD